MTDDKANAPSPELVKVQDFFTSRKALSGCPCCGHAGWTLIEIPNQELGLSMRQLDGGFVVPAPMVPVYVLACDNCGFLRAHAKAVVDAR